MNRIISGPKVSCRNRIFLLFFLLLVLGTVPAARAARLFRIGTGGATGVYYPIGKLIAQGITGPKGERATPAGGEQGLAGYIGVAQNSAGSVENARSVASGAIEAGLVQADVASWAYGASHVFRGDQQTKDLRAVASLYPEKFQIATRKDAGIKTFMDLRGKRISIDEKGSGTLAVMRIVLQAYGLSEHDLRPVYLKPAFTSDKMKKGDLQGFVMMAGAPMKAVTQLLGLGIHLVPIATEKARAIMKQYPYLVPGEIAAGVYQGIPQTPTIQVYALLVVSSKMDEDLIYRFTQALWSQRTLSLLKNGHPKGASISLKTALRGLSIPLHPGAERFYRERGMIPRKTP